MVTSKSYFRLKVGSSELRAQITLVINYVWLILDINVPSQAMSDPSPARLMPSSQSLAEDQRGGTLRVILESQSDIKT